MRSTPTADLINQLVLAGRIQQLAAQHNHLTLLAESHNVLNRVIGILVNEHAAELQAAQVLKKAQNGA